MLEQIQAQGLCARGVVIPTRDLNKPPTPIQLTVAIVF
ncbi:Unknown protein sequence [Pseudomonas savastanoi pv. phaseolicola]|nr:Unknown protein sequence [Pseudomonas savastanoi pv. phaseolicola]KPB60895.1 Unknown protein sequence [Pseudomonas amygdali pv. mellea]